LICSADFDELGFKPPESSGEFLPWGFIGNIGLNAAEQLYVALKDGTGTVSVVKNPDPNAATATDWQEWNIELTEFANLDFNDVRKVYIGLGDRDTPTKGGKGIVYIDDLRSCPPRCLPLLARPYADIAEPYDCVVGEEDMAVLIGDWLDQDSVITTIAPPDVNLVAYYKFDGNYLDSSGNGHDGEPCGVIGFEYDSIRGSDVLSLPGGSNQFVYIGAVGISDVNSRTIACWAKADHTNIPDWTLIFGFTTAGGGDNSHFNIGSLGGPGGVGAHVWGWEATIFTDEEALDWRHYAMKYDGTTVTYYGDGMLVGSVDRVLVHADNVHVGSRITQDSSFPGKVDDACIYDYDLSDAEIAYLGTDGALTLHIPITSVADLYQGELPGSQWINFRDYSIIAGSWLETVLWP